MALAFLLAVVVLMAVQVDDATPAKQILPREELIYLAAIHSRSC